jgi:heme exporter protein CcmD
MSYTPFIAGAYLISTVLLVWTALAPVFKKRGLLQQLKARQARMDKAQ